MIAVKLFSTLAWTSTEKNRLHLKCASEAYFNTSAFDQIGMLRRNLIFELNIATEDEEIYLTN